MRTRTLITSVALLCLLLIGNTPARSLAEEPTEQTTGRVPQFNALVDAYQRDYPTLTDYQALRAALGQEHRIRLLERLQSQNLAGFGGSWYDPLTDTQHINAVGTATATQAAKIGAEAGLTVVTHQVSYSFTELRAIADEINAGRHPVFGATAINAATPEVRTNKVTVALATADLDRFRSAKAALTSVIVLKERDTRSWVQDACVDRETCTTPLRSGIGLWMHSRRPAECSLGFTARAGDGSRWAVTAGHCGSASGEFATWGHSAAAIGPIQAGRDSGNIDIARIHVTNPVWQTGGYLYDFFQPNVPAPLHYSITARGTIQAGDGVCLSALHSQRDNCGTIVTAFGYRGMPQVTFDACAGDSGGGWFHITSYGENWAYGIHSSSGAPCHFHATYDSVFTAVPDMNDFWDATTAALLRLEER